MNNRHLPAGQALDGGGAPAVGMPAGAGPAAVTGAGSGPGPSPGPRRGGRPPPYQQHQHHHYNGGHHPQPHHHPHQHHPQHVNLPLYPNYMNGYPPYVYAPPMPQPYQNQQYPAGGMPSHGYVPYGHYASTRSPPSMHQYAQMMPPGAMQQPPQPAPQQPPLPAHPSSQHSFSRNQQQSPIVVSTPYQTPPPAARTPSHKHAPVVHSAAPPPVASTPSAHVPPRPASEASPRAAALAAPATVAKPTETPSSVPPPPHSPSSSLSTQAAALAPPTTPPTPQTVDTPTEQLPPSPKQQPQVKLASPPKAPFRPPLPWYTHPDLPFPSRTGKTKRRRRPFVHESSESLKLPSKNEVYAAPASQSHAPQGSPASLAAPTVEEGRETTSAKDTMKSDAAPTPVLPTTPTSTKAAPAAAAAASGGPTPPKSAKPAARAAVPAIPIVPVLPRSSPKSERHAASIERPQTENETQAPGSECRKTAPDAAPGKADVPVVQAEQASKPSTVPGAAGAPLLWTGLFSKPALSSSAPVAPASVADGSDGISGADSSSGARGIAGASSFAQSNNTLLAEALRAYRVGNGEKVAFIEPRGLINTGNMCYMNSVLQVLLFCIPFYDFLDQAGKKAAHSFKSETPLIDAMIEFMRDFKVIDSAVSVDQLRRRLKSEELEQYGEPFIPEFVYEAIKKLPRFSSMRRGHQQDAEEFLGFLLESLHDECVQILRAAPPSSSASTAPNSSVPTPTTSVHSANLDGGEANNVWLEVGPRQRPAITRSSGHSDTTSPVTKIFGGQLRSELRVPGLKDSVMLEPYQPLQLDIGSPQVRNIVDALRGLTNPESLRGDFNSPRGKDVSATKQVFIESLPPVLILHLKRFQFDAEGNGTIKIWKKVGYPLELEIPREVFSRSKRNSSASQPKYRLTGVVYHHGKNASGGHYTVDVRRQDDHEWIRLDDTVIRRIRSEDVAEGGAEEIASAASASSSELSTRKEATPANRFAGMSGGDDAGDDDGWKQVSGSPSTAPGVAAGSKKWSSIVNGSAGPSTTTSPKGPAGNSRQQQNLAKDGIKDSKVAYLLFYQRV